ncbi:MAG: glycosyltransferase family 87 protein [Anaerolineaceae bacterium]|nr:glycosyltransferase family 87 protein [Anaerolineaceae bacterium]
MLTISSDITNPAKMDTRLSARISRSEFAGLAGSFGVLCMFTWLQMTGVYQPFDFTNYLHAAAGDTSYYYYGYWALPFISLFRVLPINIAFLSWGLLNLLGIFFAIRVFGGKALYALLSYQMFYVFFYGQITGIIIGCLALFWWDYRHGRWILAGFALSMACSKYQIGVPLGIAMLLLARTPWILRIKVLMIPILVSILSLLIYPGWPFELISRLITNPPNDWGNISLWRWIGPWAFLLWIPALVLPLKTNQRLIAITAATALSLPYFQQTELLVLIMLPIGWLALLGNLGFLYAFFKWSVLQYLAVVPVAIYLSVVLPPIISSIRHVRLIGLREWGSRK